jgi:hypothetical protein
MGRLLNVGGPARGICPCGAGRQRACRICRPRRDDRVGLLVGTSCPDRARCGGWSAVAGQEERTGQPVVPTWQWSMCRRRVGTITTCTSVSGHLIGRRTDGRSVRPPAHPWVTAAIARGPRSHRRGGGVGGVPPRVAGEWGQPEVVVEHRVAGADLRRRRGLVLSLHVRSGWTSGTMASPSSSRVRSARSWAGATSSMTGSRARHACASAAAPRTCSVPPSWRCGAGAHPTATSSSPRGRSPRPAWSWPASAGTAAMSCRCVGMVPRISAAA